MNSILNNKVVSSRFVEIKFSLKCEIFSTDTTKLVTDEKVQFESDRYNVSPVN